MLFAYYVSLPAALYFLTGFNLYNINPMLTIDSYFSFVMTYMIAGALLFQLPLLMLIINGATPLKAETHASPGQNNFRVIYCGGYYLTNTRCIEPSALLAAPIVVMYQAGIIVVWLRNRKKNRLAKAAVAHTGSVTPVAAKSPNTGTSCAKTSSAASYAYSASPQYGWHDYASGQLTKRLPLVTVSKSIDTSVGTTTR